MLLSAKNSNRNKGFINLKLKNTAFPQSNLEWLFLLRLLKIKCTNLNVWHLEAKPRTRKT